jgi:hypothetical protein
LTYDDTALADGAGAQLQRILGIFALSRAIGARYLHTPVRTISYLGVAGSVDADSADVLAGLDALAPLKSDAGAQEMASRSRIVNVESFDVEAMQSEAGTSARPTLFRVLFPYKHLETNPELWQALKSALPRPVVPTGGPVKIALHVRRGDLHFLARDRLLPNEYYIAIVNQLRRVLEELGLEHVLELFSERMEKGGALRAPDFTGTTQDFPIEDDYDRFSEFDALKPITYRFNGDVIDTLRRMASADILITSKSSFSMVAGLLNPERLVLYHPFWHAPLPSWIVTRADGVFDERRVKARLVARARSMPI